MNIICIGSFRVSLRDRNGSVTPHILGPQIIADDALTRTKCPFEYLNCEAVTRIGTILLNKLMGTTGRAQNVRCSGSAVVGTGAFSIYYFEYILSADCAGRFQRVLSRRFRSES
jgi:hypothetical protein